MSSEQKSSGQEDLMAATKQSLSTLHVRRQALESEAEAIVSELTTPPAPNVKAAGIDTPLVDEEGYPRNDIDVYRARTLRGRLAEIKTDRQGLLKETERLLHQLARLQNPDKATAEREEHGARIAPKPKPKYDATTGKWVVRNWDGTVAGTGSSSDGRSFDSLGQKSEDAQNQQVASSQSSEVSTTTRQSASLSGQDTATTVSLDDVHRNLRAFARFNSVEDHSPASQAGLHVGDLLLRFGTIQLDDSSSAGDVSAAMMSVGQAVPQLASQGSSVQVVVRRPQSDNRHLTLALTLSPRPWAGRGLLGCHILPYNE